MAAYVIGGGIKGDEAMFQEYLAKVAKSFEGIQVEILALSDHPTVLEGELVPNRVILLKFEDKAAAESWYHSEVYQNEAMPIRHASAETLFLLAIDHDSPLQAS